MCGLSDRNHHTQTRHLTNHHLSSQTDRWGGRSSPGPAGRRMASSRCTRGCEIVLWNVAQGYHHNSSDERAGSWRSEEHTSELQSLMRISYAVFCLTKQTKPTYTQHYYNNY